MNLYKDEFPGRHIGCDRHDDSVVCSSTDDETDVVLVRSDTDNTAWERIEHTMLCPSRTDEEYEDLLNGRHGMDVAAALRQSGCVNLRFMPEKSISEFGTNILVT